MDLIWNSKYFSRRKEFGSRSESGNIQHSLFLSKLVSQDVKYEMRYFELDEF